MFISFIFVSTSSRLTESFTSANNVVILTVSYFLHNPRTGSTSTSTSTCISSCLRCTAVWGSGSRATAFHSLCIEWMWVVKYSPGVSPKKGASSPHPSPSSGTHFIGGYMVNCKFNFFLLTFEHFPLRSFCCHVLAFVTLPLMLDVFHAPILVRN